MTVVEIINIKLGRVSAIIKVPDSPGVFLPQVVADDHISYVVDGVLMSAERYERYRKANCRGLEPLQ